MVRLFFCILFFMPLPASARHPGWHMLGREVGCTDLQMLVRMEKLSRVPVSPEDFAQMMRERGEQVEVGPLEDSPAELIGKVIQVKLGNGKAPIFVTEEVCRTVERRQ